jgi:hypothetical protein
MDIVAIFCQIDDFCHTFKAEFENHCLPENAQQRKRQSLLLMSEVMTIMVWFHQQKYRTLKDFYTKHVMLHLRSEFPTLPSYNRFVELQSAVAIPLAMFLHCTRMARPTGVAFVDSTPLAVCDNHRISGHKVFQDNARRGKTSMGWFYGFKLHIVVSDCGELLSCALSPGNVDDRAPQVMKQLTATLWGKLVGDRGYISKQLFEVLFTKGITLITKLKKGMKNKLMPFVDKLLLRKRAVIESVNDELKNSCYVEHTRHRSPMNFLANLYAGLIAYTYAPKKPSVNYDTFIPDEMLMLPIIAL